MCASIHIIVCDNSAELIVKCEAPNSFIHSFNGTLFINGRESGLSAANFLLRGSSLRNTKWAVGMVVYTGKKALVLVM
jgi:hypothetical protein